MGNAQSDFKKVDNWFQDDVAGFFKNDLGGVYKDIIHDDTFKKITGTFTTTLTTGLSGFSNLFGNVLNSANNLVTTGGSLLNGTTFYMILGCVAVGGVVYLTRK